MVSIEITPEQAQVLATTCVLIILNVWMGIQVGMARKTQDVPQPTMYAQEDHKHAQEFNCIQRGHQNMIESLPGIMMINLFFGMLWPITFSSLTLIFIVGRVIYFNGYAHGSDNRRTGGMISHLGDIPMLLLVPQIAGTVIGWW